MGLVFSVVAAVYADAIFPAQPPVPLLDPPAVKAPQRTAGRTIRGCDAVYRFDGKARVSVALADGAAVWTATAAPDPELRTVIADTLCIPASDR